MKFAEFALSTVLQETLAALGYHTPTPVQAATLPAILAGKDVLAVAQTGTGKTASFSLPILHRLSAEAAPHQGVPRALIMVPTRELAEQVMKSLQTYGEALDLSYYATYGGVALPPQIKKLRAGVDVLVATPGRLLDLHRQAAVDLKKIEVLVLDEADRMLDLGFAKEIETLLSVIPKARQTLLFSATFSDDIRQMANRLLKKPQVIDLAPMQVAAKSVRQQVLTVDKKKKALLLCHLLKMNAWSQVLVFAKTRKGVDELVTLLLARGFSADSIHGDKPQATRQIALERFRSAEVRVLVATDVAARGIDITGLPVVINLDLPHIAEDYVHRIGRTGRAGAKGEAISLVCADEVELLAAIEKLTHQVLPRDEEPGYEASHRVPDTRNLITSALKPGAGRGGLAKGPAGKSNATRRSKAPANWVGFDDFPDNKGGRGGNRSRGR